MKKTNPDFLNGVPELLLLKLLSRREMYGYEIVRAIQAETGQNLSFGEGCIYPSLHALEKEKYVTSERREFGGRSRNYYHLTPKGVKRLDEMAGEWNRVTAGINMLFGGNHA